VSDEDGDATLTLTAEDEFVIGVTVDWCEVRIQVLGSEVALTSGDQVTVWVYEDDLTNDDLLFQTTFVVTAAEVANQHVDRTFNCSADLSLFETVSPAEVYAEAFVEKDECGTFCLADRPMTNNIDIALNDSPPPPPPPPPPPGWISATDEDNDATLTLTVLSDYIVGTTVDWCNVRIEVVGIDVAFSPGDEVTVWVYEDDAVNDDLVFQTTFTVTASEVANQLVDRTFDCNTDLSLLEAPPTAEVYAEAVVEKSACGGLCVWDRPMTSNLPINIHEPVPVKSASWGAIKALYGD